MSTSVPELASSTIATSRYNARILAFCEQSEVREMDPNDPEILRFPTDKFRPISDAVLRLRLSPILENHGIWRAYCAAAGHIASGYRKPYVVSAHGMLDEWALRNKRWKKTVYSGIIERPNLQRAACLRALTVAEAENYRSYGLRNAIVRIPNGVHLPEGVTSNLFLDKHPELRDRRLVLFLSRIHYKKGVDLLCQAWASIAAEFPNTHLVFAGPGFDGTLERTRQLVAELHIADRVTFTGMLSHPDKWSALASSTLFVLPSWSEGFSVAILEAMAASRPVIVTHQCYFPEVAREHCGWVIDPDVHQLEDALGEALSLPQSALDRLGRNGREVVAARYSWEHIGEQMVQVYDWILGGPKPSSVEVFD